MSPSTTNAYLRQLLQSGHHRCSANIHIVDEAVIYIPRAVKHLFTKKCYNSDIIINFGGTPTVNSCIEIYKLPELETQ